MAKLPDLDLGEFGGQALPDLDLAEFATPQVKEVPSGVIRRAGDYGISALKGAIGVPEAIVGLADIPTGGHAGKLAEQAGFRPKEAKAILDEYLSPEQQAANKAVSEARGFIPTVSAAIQHPSTIAQTVVESAPLMLGGGVIAQGIKRAAPKVAGYIAGAAGEGIVGAGMAAEHVRQQTPEGLLGIGQVAPVVASGAGTALFGALGGKLAQKYNIGDIDTMLAQGLTREAAEDVVKKNVVRRIVEGGVSEGVFEELPQSMQEQVWQNVALGKPATEGISEAGAMGLLAGGVMGGVAGGIGRAAPITTKPLPPPLPPGAQPTQEPSTFQEFSDFADSIDAELEARRNTLAAPTNFGKVDEFANLVQQEKTDIAAQRGLISQRQGVMRESSLESADARVTGQRIAETRTGRLSLLDEVYASGDRTPGMTFLKRLEAEYPNQLLPTPEEKAIIANRESAYQGFTQPDIEPSLPNELVMPEPGKPKQGTKFDRSILIRKLLSTKGNRVKGDAIVNKDGKPILKSVTQDELTGAQQYGQAPQVPAAGLDTGITPVAERAEPAGVLAVDGSGRMPATPVAVAGQDRVVPLHGVGNEALATPELPTPQPTQGERDALQKQEAQAAEAVIPATTNTKTAAGKKPLKIGKNALSASVVEIDPDGVVVIVSPDGERNQAQDYDTGDSVKVKPGSSNNEIYQALIKANALQGGHKAFNLEKEAKVKLEATPTESRTITPKEIGARTVLERTEMVNGERKMVKRDAENLKKLVAAANRDVEKYKALVRCLNA